MFDVLDITPEDTTPPALRPAPGVPSARDVQDSILAIARRLGKLKDDELADIERRRLHGMPLHVGVDRVPMAPALSWIELTAPDDDDDAATAASEPVPAVRPPLDIPDWLL
jgi:hypothetical protein